MELKHCPFCIDGGKPRLKRSLACPEKFVWIECEFCGVSITPESSEEDAVKTWNTRYIKDNPPLTLEDLREMDGEPVFLIEGEYYGWVLITNVFWKSILIIDREGKEDILSDGNNNIWTVYRRKPEAETL